MITQEAVRSTQRVASAGREPKLQEDLRVLCCGAARWMDIVLLTLCLGLTDVTFYFNRQPSHGLESLLAMRVSVRNLGVAALCWAAWTTCLWVSGMYSHQRMRSLRELALRVVAGSTFCSLITGVCLASRHAGPEVWRPVVFNWAVVNLLFLGGRVPIVVYARYIKRLFRKPRRVLIVGTGARALQLAHDFSESAHDDYDLIGYVDSDPQPRGNEMPVPTIGAFDDLEGILMREHIDEVFVALPIREFYDTITNVIALCERTGVQSQYQADIFKSTVAKRRVATGNDAEWMKLQMTHIDNRRHIKRVVDVCGAVAGLVLLSPVFLVIAIAIKATGRGPVVFKQVRYGLNKRRFHMFKFRSMVVDAEALQGKLEHLNESGGPVFKIKHDPRVTTIGRILRKTSMDELPQLVNVLLGQMSLVGPRPLPMRDVNLFSELSLMRRFSVKPGMTGLWQVSGRSNTSFTGWIKLDLQYIDHWSLRLDTLILIRTVAAVLRGTGAA